MMALMLNTTVCKHNFGVLGCGVAGCTGGGYYTWEIRPASAKREEETPVVPLLHCSCATVLLNSVNSSVLAILEVCLTLE